MTTEIHTTARARFEEWADIKSPHLPAERLTVFDMRRPARLVEVSP